MLAELAAFTAAAKTVAKAIQAGRELSSVATSLVKWQRTKMLCRLDYQKRKTEPLVLLKLSSKNLWL